MLKKLFQNARMPQNNWGGRLFLCGMNFFHRGGARWALRFLDLRNAQSILDVGCGGGQNIRTMLRNCPDALVFGLDFSPASVRKAATLNHVAVVEGRTTVSEGNVNAMPYEMESFDVVTAFETVYFWQPLDDCLREVWRVMKPKGRFLVMCEANDPVKAVVWTRKIKGMTAYTPQELERRLVHAGFTSVEVHTYKKRMCLIATK